jgi:hypothetical protein
VLHLVRLLCKFVDGPISFPLSDSVPASNLRCKYIYRAPQLSGRNASPYTASQRVSSSLYTATLEPVVSTIRIIFLPWDCHVLIHVFLILLTDRFSVGATSCYASSYRLCLGRCCLSGKKSQSALYIISP